MESKKVKQKNKSIFLNRRPWSLSRKDVNSKIKQNKSFFFNLKKKDNTKENQVPHSTFGKARYLNLSIIMNRTYTQTDTYTLAHTQT